MPVVFSVSSPLSRSDGKIAILAHRRMVCRRSEVESRARWLPHHADWQNRRPCAPAQTDVCAVCKRNGAQEVTRAGWLPHHAAVVLSIQQQHLKVFFMMDKNTFPSGDRKVPYTREKILLRIWFHPIRLWDELTGFCGSAHASLHHLGTWYCTHFFFFSKTGFKRVRAGPAKNSGIRQYRFA
ncbi:unnamed protein product, partial [Pylaiella littoralis]